MKLIRKSIFALASALMLTACSSDEPFVGDDPIGGSQEGEGVYMGLTIQMPGANGSRSQTVTPGQSTDGNEVGKDYENNVDNVIIVLAQKGTNAFIVAGEVSNSKLSPIASENAYKTVAKIEKTKLNTYYNKSDFNRDVNVFVFCNPTNEIRNLLTSAELDNIEWLQDITNVSSDMTTIANTANKGSFVMANFAIAQRTLPASIDDWDLYKTENTAFNLSGMNNAGTDKQVDNSQSTANPDGGAVKVERLASRFDFMDGSPLAAVNPDKAYTYNVVMQADGKTPLIQVQIGKMQLVNISKSLYSLRRVSANGLDANAVICGAETPTNYVVGPNAAIFNNTDFASFTPATYFYNPFFDATGRMNYNNFMSGATNVAEYFGNATDDNYEKGTYKIWRYAVENVIPTDPSNQQNGISTGVVFKAKMIPTEALKTVNPELYNALKGLNKDGNALTGTPDENPILYSLNGNLYLTWREVQKSAIEASVEMENNMPAPLKDKDGNVVMEGDAIVVKNVNRTNSLYLATYGQGAIGTFIWGEAKTKYIDKGTQDDKSANFSWEAWNANKNETTIGAMRAAVTGAGFTIYQTSTDDNLGGIGYYCYYYYWNRHNDNNKPGIMGDMEFAVVRNNVYKLAVTNIKQLGHPRIPENDPDKPKPDTPDESSDIYITVTCQVLPWVVRVNNIEF